MSTGVPGGQGTVERFDGRTGRRVGTFIDIPAGRPGHLPRATGMAWHDGDLLVASQGDGKVKRFDGRTGAWKADVASASPGGLTQIAVRDGRLFLTDFVSQTLRGSDMTGAEAPAPLWMQRPGHAPVVRTPRDEGQTWGEPKRVMTEDEDCALGAHRGAPGISDGTIVMPAMGLRGRYDAKNLRVGARNRSVGFQNA